MAMCCYGRKLLLPILLVISQGVWAESQNLLVGLGIQSIRMELKYPDAVRKTDLSRLDLLWYEPLNSWLDGSLKLGVLDDITQNSNPIPAGQTLSGNSLGLGLRFHLYQSERLNLHANLDYQYTDTKVDQPGQSVEMRWHQVSGQLEADIHLLQYSFLSLAVGAVSIDGDERATGTVTSLQTFTSDKPGFGRLGVKIGVDPTSHIVIEVSAGSIAGGRISFQRWF